MEIPNYLYGINNKTFSKMKDKNGITPKVGDTIVGLYDWGDDTGIVILDMDGKLAVKDSDGDIIEIESALKVGTVKH